MKNRKYYVDVMQGPTEVTGTFIPVIVKIDDKTIKFAVDCGLYQEREYEERNSTFPVAADGLDFVLLTHNHVDHTGRLPYLVKKGFCGKIYTTAVTKELLPIGLEDTEKIIRKASKHKKKEPLYDAIDVEKTLFLVESVDYNDPIKVNENITVTFVPNGHLVGAACILVQVHCHGEKDINLFFTGDYNCRNRLFRVAPIRKWITQLPINIVTESTYGDMESSKVQKVFEKNVVKAIKEKKTVVVPVFSLGRAQEILYLIKDMQRKYSDIFEDIPIYYDGKMSKAYTGKYQSLQSEGILKLYKDKSDFLPENLVYIKDKIDRASLLSQKDACRIIVTSSGNLHFGPAPTYVQKYIGNPNALFHLTGYCTKDTLGYRLKYTAKNETIDIGGIKCVKRADVVWTTEFSAHAKADELIAFLNKFENINFIMVTHGEFDTKDIFADRILKDVDVEYVGVLGGEYFFRIGPNGYMKGYRSKF